MNRDLAVLVGLGLLPAVAFGLGRVFPEWSSSVWVALVVTSGMLMWREVVTPVSYQSFVPDQRGFVLTDLSGTAHRIEWDAIAGVYVSITAATQDSGHMAECLVHLTGGKVVPLPTEALQRRHVLRSFQRHLVKFDAESARAALSSKQVGSWHCFNKGT